MAPVDPVRAAIRGRCPRRGEGGLFAGPRAGKAILPALEYRNGAAEGRLKG